MKTTKKPMTPLRKRVFTVQEVAQQCDVHIASIYRAIYTGKLKTLAGFGRSLISDAELERFLATNRDYPDANRIRRAALLAKMEAK